MSTIKTDFGAGGAGLTPGAGAPDVATALRDVADDLEALRAALAAALAKLDADGGVTDTNYAALHAVASITIKTKKG